LDAVDLPVLIVSGTHDPSAPPVAVEELTRRLPQSYVHQSAELSHFCQLQQPDVVATTIANFLMQQGITHHNQSHDTTHETTMEAISA
jgi:pimeloyl-ACP methyl ester carboxylesterase